MQQNYLATAAKHVIAETKRLNPTVFFNFHISSRYHGSIGIEQKIGFEIRDLGFTTIETSRERVLVNPSAYLSILL